MITWFSCCIQLLGIIGSRHALCETFANIVRLGNVADRRCGARRPESVEEDISAAWSYVGA